MKMPTMVVQSFDSFLEMHLYQNAKKNIRKTKRRLISYLFRDLSSTVAYVCIVWQNLPVASVASSASPSILETPLMTIDEIAH